MVKLSRPGITSLKERARWSLASLNFLFHILLLYPSEPSLVVDSQYMSMSHSVSQHFSQFLSFFIITVGIIIIIILIISFWDFMKVVNSFFKPFNFCPGMRFSPPYCFANLSEISFSVFFILCYDCDSSEDCNKLYNNYCKLLAK